MDESESHSHSNYVMLHVVVHQGQERDSLGRAYGEHERSLFGQSPGQEGTSPRPLVEARR